MRISDKRNIHYGRKSHAQATTNKKMSSSSVEVPFPLSATQQALFQTATRSVQELFVQIWTMYLYQYQSILPSFGFTYTEGPLTPPMTRIQPLIDKLRALGDAVLHLGLFSIGRELADHLYHEYLLQTFGDVDRIEVMEARAAFFVRFTQYIPGTQLPVPYPTV